MKYEKTFVTRARPVQAKQFSIHTSSFILSPAPAFTVPGRNRNCPKADSEVVAPKPGARPSTLPICQPLRRRKLSRKGSAGKLRAARAKYTPGKSGPTPKPEASRARRRSQVTRRRLQVTGYRAQFPFHLYPVPCNLSPVLTAQSPTLQPFCPARS